MRIRDAIYCFALALVTGCSHEPPMLDVPPSSAPAEQAQAQAGPAQSAAPVNAPSAEDLAKFKRLHGSAYDPLSRADRAKMDALRGTSAAVEPSPAPSAETMRQRVVRIAQSYVGQQETNGANRSPLIDRMNRLTNVPLGSPYCASFNALVYSEALVPKPWPLSAWSPDWVANPTWTSAKGGTAPAPGDAFGIWFANKGRVAHTGLVKEWQPNGAVITLEANTSPTAAVGSVTDRDGDGIWSKRRLRSQIHSARNWIKK